MNTRTVVGLLVGLLVGCQQGPKGEAGPTGPVGAAGAVGPQGPAGPAGERGPAGEQGGVGPQGPQGQVVVLAVEDGGVLSVDGGVVVVSGPTGPVGPQGPTGPAGAVLLVAAADGGAVAFDGGVAIVSGPPGPAGRDARYGESAAHFAGFTNATIEGVARGRHRLHAACAAEFPGSHMCHFAEYMLSRPTAQAPSGGAWIDASGVPASTGDPLGRLGVATSSARYFGGRDTCNNWTTDSSGVAMGSALSNWPHYPLPCATPRSVACCDSVYRERFAGFTAMAFDGQAGGPEGMNRRCHQSFPGSHFCGRAELMRAAPLVASPGSVWIQPDSSQVAVEDAPPDLTNSAAPSCGAWTSTAGLGASFSSAVPSGGDTIACASQAPLACCF